MKKSVPNHDDFSLSQTAKSSGSSGTIHMKDINLGRAKMVNKTEPGLTKTKTSLIEREQRFESLEDPQIKS